MQKVQKATAGAAKLGKRTWKLSYEHVNASRVMAHAIRAVKDLVLKNLTPNGLTTTEIFQLTQRIPTRQNFRPAIIPRNAIPPPSPNELIRSPSYLKRWILPILEGNGIIRMKRVLRASTPSGTPSEKGQESADPTPASSTATKRLWAWVLVDPAELSERKLPENKLPERKHAKNKHPQRKRTPKAPADVDPVWFNMYSRPKRIRFERAVNHYVKMRDAVSIEDALEEEQSRGRRVATEGGYEKTHNYYQNYQKMANPDSKEGRWGVNQNGKGGQQEPLGTWTGEYRNVRVWHRGMKPKREWDRRVGGWTKGPTEGEIFRWLRSGRKGIDRTMDEWPQEKRRARDSYRSRFKKP